LKTALILALAVNAAAQSVPPVKPLEVPARIGILGNASISLNEVVHRVLANDKDLAISRIMREEAVFNVNGAKGYFDPKLGFTGHDLRTVTPASSSLSGSTDGKLTNKELLADPSVSGSSPFLGTTYKLDFSSARQTSDSTFLTLNPQFPTSVNLNLTQPLWRGLFYDDNRHRLQVAKKNVQLTNEQLRQQVIAIVTQAVQ